MIFTNDHWLEINYKGWSNEALEERRINLIRFSGSELELEMIEMEQKRRKGVEKVG